MFAYSYIDPHNSELWAFGIEAGPKVVTSVKKLHGFGVDCRIARLI